MFSIARKSLSFAFCFELKIDYLSLSFSLFSTLMTMSSNHQFHSPLITVCSIPLKCQRQHTNQCLSFNLYPFHLATGEQLPCYIRAWSFESPTLPPPTGSSEPATWQEINSRISSLKFALKSILCFLGWAF